MHAILLLVPQLLSGRFGFPLPAFWPFYLEIVVQSGLLYRIYGSIFLYTGQIWPPLVFEAAASSAK
jgi:hypothetical protein